MVMGVSSLLWLTMNLVPDLYPDNFIILYTRDTGVCECLALVVSIKINLETMSKSLGLNSQK